MPSVEQLGSSNGTRFAMASIAGRPFNVGFSFRVVAAQSGTTAAQRVLNVIEYNYDSASFTLEDQRQLLSTVPHELTKGSFLEFTAGRNRDQFTVVLVECSDRCEVYLLLIGPSLVYNFC